MDSKDTLTPLPSSDDVLLKTLPVPSSSQPSSTRKRKPAKIHQEKLPKHKLNPNDPKWTKKDKKSIKKSIVCRQRRVKEAERLENLKKENIALKEMNARIPQLIAEKVYLESVVFWQAAQNEGLVKHLMEMHENQFSFSGDEDSLTNYLWEENPFSSSA